MKRLKGLFSLIVALVLALAVCAGCGAGNMLEAPVKFNVDDEYVLSWNEVASARGYKVKISQTDGTEVKTESPKRAAISLAFLEEGDYLVAVKAIGDGTRFVDSKWSEDVNFHKNYESGCIYRLIKNNTEYEIQSYGTAEGELEVEDYYRDKPVTSIGNSAFSQAVKITRVVLGKNVESIGENAFFRCSNLEEIVIPDGVDYIGPKAFQSCDKLKSIDLPEALTEISDYCFTYCSGLTSFNFKNVTRIGASAFANCNGLTQIEIPDTVTSLGASCFSGCDSLASVTLGNGLTGLPASAFSMCKSLKNVSFGGQGNLTSIGKECFAECETLAHISLPDGLESIGSWAFYDSASLVDVNIPESVTNVGVSAFNATGVYNAAAELGDKFVYVDNWLVATLPGALMGVTQLSSNNLKSGIVGIAGAAFSNRSSEENTSWSFNVPGTLKYICDSAFEKTSLWRLVSNNNSKLVSIGNYAFSECKMLDNLILNEGLQTIGASAFRGCERLNNSMTFSIIPSTVTRIGAYAFRDTALYADSDEYGVVYAGLAGEESWIVDYKETGETGLVLKNTVYGIADQAFYGAEKVVSITGLNRASIIGYYAFGNCKKLSAISLNPNLDVIKQGAFCFCSALTDVSIPVRVKSIEAAAFYGCEDLVEVRNIGSNALRTIGYGAFVDCTSFKGENGVLAFGNNLQDIEEYAFYNCTSITKAVIPDSIKIIKAHTFSHCDSLEEVDFGHGVEEIGDYAFYVIDKSDEATESEAEEEGEKKAPPAGTIINLPDSVKRIGNYAFYGCKGRETTYYWDGGDGLKSGKRYETFIGSGVEEIGEFAFSKARIGTVVLPSTLKKIGKYAFYDSVIDSMLIPDNVESIERHAFNGCKETTIYVQRTGFPQSWDVRWNSSYATVIWGCELSDDGSYVVAATGGDSLWYRLNDVFAPTRIGYAFLGWTVTPGSSEADYGAGEFCDIPDGTKVYAVWRAAQS